MLNAESHLSVKLYDHLYIFATIFFTVYSQLIMRWQVGLSGTLEPGLESKILFLLKMLINPWVISGIISTFLAGLAWMMTMTKFEISYAFPFVSLNYLAILGAGHFLFGEDFSTIKMSGTLLIIAGLVIISKG